jgi:hypothetical protein
MTGKTHVDYTASKQMAIEQFGRRRRLAAGIERVENVDLPAGSPMYFYCRHCELPTEILPRRLRLPAHHGMQPVPGFEERRLARRGGQRGGIIARIFSQNWECPTTFRIVGRQSAMGGLQIHDCRWRIGSGEKFGKQL